MAKKLDRLLLPAAYIITLCFLPACNRIKDQVRIEGGIITGVTGIDSSIKAYKGVPFAAPPVGSLRWREPQPVKPWTGILAADKFTPACIQNVPRSRLPWTKEFMHQGSISEDCLYLNVWTGAKTADEKRPVMVYLYGGGFSEGSNAVAVYDGEELAKKGVVMVTVNYRLGLLGFLAHPELTAESPHHVSGNYGLLDQAAALRWVRHNITAFGGDPDKVTVFGQSAGAMSVAMLMQSPLAKGFIRRAIIQSGPGLFSASTLSGSTPLKEAEQAGVRFGEAKGALMLADLRAMPAEKLLAEAGMARIGPITDGYFLPAGTFNGNPVAVINGFTADDLGAGGSFEPSPPATVIDYEKEARERYRELTGSYLALYPALSDADVPALSKTSARDRSRVSLFLWASQQAPKSEKVYTYYFDRAIPWPEHPEFGAFHSGEIPYVFNNLRLMDRPWEDIDRTVANEVSTYWTNFAKAGDPNGPDLPVWPRFRASQAITMELGARMGAMPIADAAKVAFWTEILKESSR